METQFIYGVALVTILKNWYDSGISQSDQTLAMKIRHARAGVPHGLKTRPVCAEAIGGEPCSTGFRLLLALDPRRAKVREF